MLSTLTTGRIKKTLIIVILAAGLGSIALADDYQFRLEHAVNFNQAELQFDQIGDYDMIRLGEREYLNDPGRPMLPARRIRLALPETMTAEQVRLIDIKTGTIEGTYDIFPAQPPIEIGQSIDNMEFVAPDKSVYESNSLYPADPVRLIRQSDLAGQSFVDIDFYPVQYIPGEKRLIVNLSFTLIIEGNDGYVCGDYLPNAVTELQRQQYHKRLTRIISNPENIQLRQSPSGALKNLALPGGGPYEHVIITNQYVTSLFTPLTEWHNRRGLRDTIITTEYIYANYDGASEKEQIRNFVIDAHQNWGTVYFLIGGEHIMVPFEYRQYDGTSIPSDAYYADYDDDWECEVMVGRISAETFEEIERFVNKVIEYETTPPDLNYIADITLLGMDLTLSNQAPYYTLTRTEWLKDSIDIAYLASNLSVTTVYDTDGGNHRDAFLAAINDGQNLINHSDHSNRNVMGCGSLAHGWHISSYDVPYLTNYHKYCNIVSLGCYANQMDYGDAISEHFVFRTDSTGAVSFTGNTRSGWFYVGDPFSLSSALDLQWWIGLFVYDQYHLGEALNFAKEHVNTESVWPYSEWTFSLLGDPAMPLWTAQPEYFIVTHETETEALPQTFNVHVEKFGGIPVAGSRVCLYKGDEIYEVVETDADGNAAVEVYPTTRGEIKITVTKRNHIPYLGSAEVVGNVPPQCLVPDDTTIFQCQPAEVSLPVGCFDPDGNLASGPSLVRGPGELVGGYWLFTPSAEGTVEISIICTDSLGYSCESSFFVTFDFNDMPFLTLPDDTAIMHIAPAAELTLPIAMQDDNIVDCAITGGPGVLNGNSWQYTPEDDEEVDVTIQLTDACGMYDEGTFHVSYEVFTCGDANDNLEINILDISYIIEFLYNSGPAPDPIRCGDANDDETINILDATYLIAYLYQSGPPPICR